MTFLLMVINNLQVRWPGRFFGPFKQSTTGRGESYQRRTQITSPKANMVLTFLARQLAGSGKSSALHLILGGAAVHRCDSWIVSEMALATEVLRRGMYFFRNLLMDFPACFCALIIQRDSEFFSVSYNSTHGASYNGHNSLDDRQDCRGDLEEALRVRQNPQGSRKSTRLNSSHLGISYAVFCLKKTKVAGHKSPGTLTRTHCTSTTDS